MQEDLAALDRFMHTLEWLLAVSERHPNAIRFGFIHVGFQHTEQLGQSYGARDAVHMLVELSRQLRTSLRRSDLVARVGTDFWILVPYTSPATLTEKVAMLVEVATRNGLNIVGRDVAVFSMPDPEALATMDFKSPSDFLEHLKNNRQIALRWQNNG